MTGIDLLLIGAGIALVSSLVTSIVNHTLSLRADKVKRQRDAEEEKAKGQEAFLHKYGKREHRGYIDDE